MSERNIIFSAAMVGRLRAHEKTVTRRPVKGLPAWASGEGTGTLLAQPWAEWSRQELPTAPRIRHMTDCPYGGIGTTLRVRETWGIPADPKANTPRYHYAADGDEVPVNLLGGRWKSPIHMPRAASRITLVVTDLRVERLHDITEAQARAEGILCALHGTDAACGCLFARDRFRELWADIHGAHAWEANPWLWVVSFRVALPCNPVRVAAKAVAP